MKTKKQLIRLTESDLHRVIKESVNRILRESIMDNMTLMVDKRRYGSFWLRDINSWIEFNADAWIQDGRLMCDVDSDDRRGSQMCKSDDFVNMCASAILNEYPENISGFQEFVEEVGDYDDALYDLANQLENVTVDTYTNYNKRVAQNIKDSGDASSLRYM